MNDTKFNVLMTAAIEAHEVAIERTTRAAELYDEYKRGCITASLAETTATEAKKVFQAYVDKHKPPANVHPSQED